MTDKDLIKNLNSSTEETVIETLKLIKTEGNNDVLIHIIKLFEETTNNAIKNEITNILENLKEQSSAQIIIDAINSTNKEENKSILIASCWKNGLNYENHLSVFTNIFIDSDFQIAFDAFTVIDTFENVDRNIANENLTKLNKSVDNLKDEKKALCLELINIIEDKLNNPVN
ncbi:MAG: hypothetical protein MI739_00850 [Bacteroidales bacterium]|nr:hypothetical protein [Bacteroidales bacterium]